jgi:hypothetical protein
MESGISRIHANTAFLTVESEDEKIGIVSGKMQIRLRASYNKGSEITRRWGEKGARKV